VSRSFLVSVLKTIYVRSAYFVHEAVAYVKQVGH